MSLLRLKAIGVAAFSCTIACVGYLAWPVMDSTRATRQEPTATVLISELPDPDDSGRFSGLFAAHRENESGGNMLMGPVDVPIEEAIAWGRSQAQVVLVRIGDSLAQYSAGDRQVLDDHTRPWPPDGLKIAARPEGSSLDGSEQVVPWRVEATAKVPTRTFESLVSVLSDSQAVAHVESVSPAAGQLALVVRARGVTPAMEMAWRLVSGALSDVAGSHAVGKTQLTLDDVVRAPA